MRADKHNRDAGPPTLALEINEGWRYFIAGEPVEEPGSGPLVRVCGSDWAAVADARLSGSRLKDQGKRLVRARVVAFRRGTWACFTAEANRSLAGRAVTPVSALLFDVLDDKEPGCILDLPLVDGFHALTVWRKNREISPWSLVREEDLKPFAERLVQDAGIGDIATLVLPPVFDLPDMQSATGLPVYPLEDEWHGVPVRRLMQGVAVAALVLVGIGALDWMAAKQATDASAQKLADTQGRLAHTKARAGQWNQVHAGFVARQGTIDWHRLFATAQAVCPVGAHVVINDGGKRMFVIVPMESFPNLVTGQWVSADVLDRVLARPAPPGWSSQGIARSGNSGQYVVTYVKTGAAS